MPQLSVDGQQLVDRGTEVAAHVATPRSEGCGTTPDQNRRPTRTRAGSAGAPALVAKHELEPLPRTIQDVAGRHR